MSDIARLTGIVDRLRAPDGCPWDREQTHESLRSALLEECYEVLDAITRRDDANLREELGDILLHVVMHAQMAGERGAFAWDDIVEGVCEKLIRRHPHVFAAGEAANSGEVLKQWERIKRIERGVGASVMDGLPAALPALLRAQNAQKKAARVGFDWSAPGAVLSKVEEEIRELRQEMEADDSRQIGEELGDLLFAVVNLARHLKVDAETTLDAATQKFIRRFRAVEEECLRKGRPVEECAPEVLNAIWEAVKSTEKESPHE